MLQITAPTEMIILFQFQVRMRDTAAKMHIAVPTVVLEPIIHIFDQEWHSRKKIIQDRTFLLLLRSIPVKVSIETTDTIFPMDALMSLQVGDTLVLDQRQEWPVRIKVAGKEKMCAQARMDPNRKTFGITGLIGTGREETVNGHVS
jgi:flagellar motor switch protein FliM